MTFSIQGDVLNDNIIQNITIDITNGWNNKIVCGVECIFNSDCDFFLFQSTKCYLASYDKINTSFNLGSSEIGSFHNKGE